MEILHGKVLHARLPKYWSEQGPFSTHRRDALPDQRLRLIYADGQTFEVGLDEWIATSPILRPLKETALFTQARIGFAGRTAVIDDAFMRQSVNRKEITTLALINLVA